MARNYVTALYVKQVTQALSKKFKVSVRKGRNWSADIEKGVLTYGPEIHYLTHTQALGLLCHEIGHLRYTKRPKETELSKKFPVLHHDGVNMLEDKRIEKCMSVQFPGGREAIRSMRERLNAKCAVSLVEIGEKLKKDFDEAVDMCIKNGTKPFQTLAELQKYQAEDVNRDDKKSCIAHSVRMSYHAPISTQILILASLLHEGTQVPDYPDKEVEARAKRVAEKMRKGRPEDMQSTQEIADFFESEVYPEISEYFTEKEERSANGNKYKAGTEQSDEEKNSCGGKTMSEEMRETISEMHEESTGEPLKFNDRGRNASAPTDFNYDRTSALVQSEVGNAVRPLQRILKDKKYDRYGGRFLTGKLNSRKLYKHRMGDMRLFKRKVLDNKRDFAFAIAVDVSGSMNSRGRIQNAQKATVLLLELMTKAEVPVSLVTFGSGVTTVKGVDDELNEKKVEKHLGELESSTRLHDGIAQATKELMHSGRTNKVLITITDGQVWGHEKREIRELIAKRLQVHYYGIGVQIEVNDIFGENSSFNLKNVDELVPALLGILKKHIRN